MPLQKFQNLGCGERAHDTIDFETVKHENKGGDRIDAELAGGFLNVFGVHLYDDHLALGACSDFFQFWADHFAWATPFSPEIDKDGQAGLSDQRLELLVRGDVNALRWKVERVFTFPALNAFLERLESEPISSTTGGAIQ